MVNKLSLQTSLFLSQNGLFSESFYKLCFCDKSSCAVQNQVSLLILIFDLIDPFERNSDTFSIIAALKCEN
jgi:hypothetical protein